MKPWLERADKCEHERLGRTAIYDIDPNISVGSKGYLEAGESVELPALVRWEGGSADVQTPREFAVFCEAANDALVWHLDARVSSATYEAGRKNGRRSLAQEIGNKFQGIYDAVADAEDAFEKEAK